MCPKLTFVQRLKNLQQHHSFPNSLLNEFIGESWNGISKYATLEALPQAGYCFLRTLKFFEL